MFNFAAPTMPEAHLRDNFQRRDARRLGNAVDEDAARLQLRQVVRLADVTGEAWKRISQAPPRIGDTFRACERAAPQRGLLARLSPPALALGCRLPRHYFAPTIASTPA